MCVCGSRNGKKSVVKRHSQRTSSQKQETRRDIHIGGARQMFIHATDGEVVNMCFCVVSRKTGARVFQMRF